MIAAAISLITGGSATRLAATLLAGALLGGWGAHQFTAWAYRSQQLKTAERAAKDLARAVEQQDRAVTAYIEGRGNAETIYKTITRRVDKIVERPVYLRECLDDDGMQQLRAAIAGRATPEPSPAPALPATE